MSREEETISYVGEVGVVSVLLGGVSEETGEKQNRICQWKFKT